ncbi:Glucan endo-1 [Diplonema papillatum]|nr:Glucan endo-1 [Diplonema papillatum]
MPPSPSPATSIPPSSSPATSIPPSSSPATSILPSPSPVTPTPSPSSSSPVTPTPSPTSSTPAIPSSSSPSSSPATSKSPATSPPETPTPSSPSSSPATSKSPATSPPETPTPSSPSSLPATSMPPSSSPAASMPPSSLPAASMPPSSLPAASMPPSSSSPATPTPPSPPFPPRTTVAWQLVWSDEFSGTSIDSDKWTHEVNCDGGGNNEQQCYTMSSNNSWVSNGVLTIKAMPATGQALPYSSARLSSKNNGDWTYGKFEARMKLPSGQGSWPAFWMLPTDNEYGAWPLSGEIDIMEAVNLKAGGEGNIHGTLHYGNPWPHNKYSGSTYLLPHGANPADDFHTYTVEWEEGEIRWYVDGTHYQTQRRSTVAIDGNGNPVGLKHRGWFHEVDGKPTFANSPFDKNFYLLLNFAVGGDWPSNAHDRGIDAAAFANGQFMSIDYVRVYQCPADPATGKGCGTVASLIEGTAPDVLSNAAAQPVFHLLPAFVAALLTVLSWC